MNHRSFITPGPKDHQLANFFEHLEGNIQEEEERRAEKEKRKDEDFSEVSSFGQDEEAAEVEEEMEREGRGFLPEGRRFEQNVFGYTMISPKEFSPPVEYYEFVPALLHAKKAAEKRRWNSKNPDQRFLISRLLEGIRKKIERLNRHDVTVEVFPTLGTVADLCHNVDGFFLFRFKGDPKRAWLYVFDLSLRPGEESKGIDVLGPADFNEPGLTQRAIQIVTFVFLGIRSHSSVMPIHLP